VSMMTARLSLALAGLEARLPGNRGEQFSVWRQPFVELRVSLLCNLRRDPFEKSQHNSNAYHDWFLNRVFGANAAIDMKD
jgi:hypothetical protein